MKQFLTEEYGYPVTKVVVIPNGWEGEPPEPSTAPRPTPTVVCVGGFRREKGHATLLSAFARVHQQLPDARLRLVGDGYLRASLMEQAASAGLQGSVDFVGNVDDVWPHLGDADVFAMASQFESFGIVLVEAMAAGLPVVAPSVGGIPELVIPGHNGQLFQPGDVAALAEHIVNLLRSPALRARMGAAARQVARSFPMGATVQRYFELYDGMLPRRVPG